MIGKVKLTRNLSGALSLLEYILTDKKGPGAKKDRAKIIATNYCFGDKAELKSQFQMLLSDCKLKSPAMHVILSLAPGESLNESEQMRLLDIVGEKMGISDYMFVAVVHDDVADTHRHYHIAIARKSPLSGKTLTDSMSYAKVMQVCRQAEVEFGLQRVAHPRARGRIGSDKRKAKMRAAILQAIKTSRSMDGFISDMESRGYEVKKGRGIAFIEKSTGMYAKGSDPQVGFSLKKLEQIFENKMAGIDLEAASNSDFESTPTDIENKPDDQTSSWVADLFGGSSVMDLDVNAESRNGRRPLDDEDEWTSKRKRRHQSR